MKTNREKIADEIVRLLKEEYYIPLLDIKSDKRHEYYTFRLKHARRWLCGLRIFTDMEKRYIYHISIFAEPEDYIDRFGPNDCRMLCHRFDLNINLKNRHETLDDELLFNCVSELRRIVHHPLIMRYMEQGIDDEKNMIRYIISDLWFYRVTYRLSKFCEYRLTRYKAYLAGCIIRIFHPKIRFKVEVLGKGWYPNSILKISYERYENTINEDEEHSKTYKVYHSRIISFFRNRRTKISTHWRLEDYMSLEDERGFYYASSKDTD